MLTQGGRNSIQSDARPAARARNASTCVEAVGRVLARDDPAVDLDLAPVGDDVDALPPLDPADREARRAEDGSGVEPASSLGVLGQGARRPRPSGRSRCRRGAGVELWQATPRVRIFQRTAPLWQLTMSSRVGSATIARSAPCGLAARCDEPVWVNSSSTVQAMTTEAEPARPLAAPAGRRR